MSITKETEIAKIEVVGQYKAIQVRTDTVIKEDGKEISRSSHRHVKHPDDDMSAEDAEVQSVANAIWTDEIKSAWSSFKANQDS